tara:strand:+ start:7929 stop:8795 length:867 start_codon:yes stop_codon:yes gene_type:complete
LKILITGPEGTIASNLIKNLPKNYKIYSISSRKIKKNSRISRNLKYEGNYLDLKKFLISIDPKIIVHLSTKWKKFDEDSNQDLIDSNITFGSYLLDISSQLKLKVFINTSSYTQINSKGIFKPFNFYSASKEAFSNMLYYFFTTKKFKVINLRLMNVYGNIKDKRIVNYIFNEIRNKKKDIYLNDSNAYIDLIHIDDVINAIITLIKKNNYDDYVKFSYDLSSKKQIKIIELINLIEEITGYKFRKVKSKKIFNEYLKVPFRKKRLLNWSNKVSIRDGLKKHYDLFFP